MRNGRVRCISTVARAVSGRAHEFFGIETRMKQRAPGNRRKA